MTKFKKQFLFVAASIAILVAGGVAIYAVNNRGNAPVAWWKFDEGYASTTYDASGSGNNGTLTGGVQWKNEPDCKTGKCLYFDGTNDYVASQNNIGISGANARTVSAWIKIGALSGVGKVDTVVGWGAGNTGLASVLGVVGSNGQLFAWGWSYNLGGSILTAGTWYHIAFTYNGTTLKLYINGKLDKSGNQTWNTTNSVLYIGNGSLISATWLTYFKGLIDDVRIYDYARSASQIKADYLAAAGGKGGGVKVGSAQEKQAASEGLVAYWKMDEASWNGTANEVVDSSGSGKHGTATNANTTSTAKFGSAGAFDGSGDYVTTADGLSSITALTWGGWFKFDTLDTNVDLINKNNYGDYTLQKYSNNNIYCYIDASTIYEKYSTISDTNWHHIVCVYDGANRDLRAYLDGVEMALTASNGTIPASVTGSGSLILGSSTGGANFLDGYIDDVKIYKVARTAEQIRRDYESGPPAVAHWKMDENTGTTAYDTSGSNNGTLGGGTAAYRPTWANGKFGSALNFDGTDDIVTSTDSSGLDIVGGITVAAWIYPRTGGATGQGGSIAIKRDAYYFQIYLPTDERLGVYLVGVASPGWYYSASEVTLNTWQYVAFTYDGTNVKIYINGNLSSTSGNTSGSISASNYDLEIGSAIANARDFNGLIDDVRIYDYARTPKQILEDMNVGHPAVGSPVGSYVGYWPFDEGYGTTAYDQSINQNNLTLSISSAWSTNGKFGNAFEGDGSTRYASRADDSDFDFNDAFTISAWAKPDNTDIDGRVVYRYDATSKDGYYLSQSSTGNGAWQFVEFVNPTYKIIYSNSPPTGNWQHIVGVREVDGTIKMYVDGVLQSNTDTLAGAIDSSGILYIGQDFAGLFRFDGLIDEVKVYPFVLSPEEIKQEYNQGASLALGAKSTASDGATADNSASREYCVPGDTTSCSAPVAHWRMDEKTGQYAYDVAGTNDGTLGADANAGTDDPTWKSSGSCHTGACLSFDGTDDYLSVNDADSLSMSGGFTLSAWIKVNDAAGTGWGAIIQKGAVIGTNQFEYELTYYQNNIYAAHYQQGLTSGYLSGTSAGNPALNDNKWHHVVVVENTDSTILTAYIDGLPYVLDTTTSGTRATSGTSLLNIGRKASVERYFNGLIDDVRIYDYARSQAQIAWDYNRGKPVGWWKMDEGQDTATTCNATGATVYDYSGQGNTGTLDLSGSPATSSAWSEGKYNCALDFDGTNDYVSVASAASLNMSGTGLSIALWAKADEIKANQFLLGRNTFWWFSAFRTTGNYFALKIAGAAQTVNYDAEITLAINTWYHFVGTYDGTQLAIYVNGVLLNTLAATGNLTAPTTALIIGNYSAGGAYPFNGIIDDVRVYNYALTATQVKNVYNEGSAVRFGPTEGLP